MRGRRWEGYGGKLFAEKARKVFHVEHFTEEETPMRGAECSTWNIWQPWLWNMQSDIFVGSGTADYLLREPRRITRWRVAGIASGGSHSTADRATADRAAAD